MKRFFVLSAVLVSFVLSACAVENDTPTPTKTPEGKVVVPESPPVIKPVEPNGRLLPLEVTLSPTTPSSAIVIGGRDKPVVFTRYRVKNPNNVLVRLTGAVVTQMDPNGDIADFTHVGIESDASPGLVVGYGAKPYLTMSDVAFDFALAKSPFEVPAISEIEITISGWMSQVLPSSSVGGAWNGVPRSGHTPSLELTRLTTEKAGSARIFPHAAPSMVLRKSQPIVTQLALPSTTLANVEMPLFRFRVAGLIGMKQVEFTFKKTHGLVLKGLRLCRDTTYLPWETYDAVVYYGTKKIASEIGADVIGGSIIVRFVDEEIVRRAREGNTYTLVAIVSGATAGQEFTIGFTKSLSTRSVTGQLAISDGFFGIRLADGTPAYSTFLWTDRSEVPHSDRIGEASVDWINDLFVQDRTGSVTLSL